MSETVYDKLWRTHVVDTLDDGSTLLYIDRHIIHEVTSPQAFAGLDAAQRDMWRQSSVIATVDHIIPTEKHALGIAGIEDEIAREMAGTLDANCAKHQLRYFDIHDKRQGIVHIVAPEQGGILPGMTVVCGDSHTSTNGAFAALAQGIGTSDIEHVLATQCLLQPKSKSMQVVFDGKLAAGVGPKDMILYLIGVIGTAGGTGYAMEYCGDAIRSMSMEGRMTICNMSIEAGARAGMVAVDETTIQYLQDKPLAPKGRLWQQACVYWRTLVSDADAQFDKVVHIDCATITPQVSWGTSPEMVTGIDTPTPILSCFPEDQQSYYQSAYTYMGLKPGQALTDIAIDVVFIGSCTNARIEDLRAAASVAKGKHVNKSVTAYVVPGSKQVRQQAEDEGLDEVFIDAGFMWREPGCSMCLAMNPDKLMPGQRCASTSNRNFEGRQGYGGRTHLVSPMMAAAAAVEGHFIDVRKWI